MLKKLFAVVLVIFIALEPAVGFAQAADQEEKPELTGPRKQLATIVFSGLAGAILGLSTLSFYGRPQDNLKNIAIGFAIGVIGGTAYASYKAAMRPDEFYGDDLGEGALNDFHYYHRPKAQVIGPVYLAWSF